MSRFEFKQVDVFSAVALKGNPVAVVLNADSLTDAQMVDFARWTNLSETTFVLKPQNPEADYRLRIFTTLSELPFAGHPTLGSCHAWLEAGGKARGEVVIQECSTGLIRIRHRDGPLAFTAPPLLRQGAVEDALLQRICRGLGIELKAVVQARWVDNGPGWIALLLRDREQVLALKPDYAQLMGLSIGVVAPWNPECDGDEAQFEVRAFCAGEGMSEDPVTGSLNAGLAQWLIGEGLAPARYVASQGTAMGRAGRVSIEQIGEDIWVGGSAVTCISGWLDI
ncbi:phenazine biosynthesis protein PhzF family [Pseudomonas taetrolens]|uniref:Phenazine biosynthesis protein PhzF n=1 Tax=Pseudomonas taetrolens TaxID=47884 RepID=A0A0J6GLF2_PSETA|nr:PhzF family phenazine biosynthesis protein [Pseudomonas taetrolens]KMM83188.1 phenazine biosynthesis protein PhzF [Pseudomonas taetrolens]SEC77656.1 phenazine biosynthesis protein PhzF family [Pseudomonas taetrolens]SQF87150.1 PhzF family phenazine biosynthesis protein [Pseudomonas taetrolens]VEH50345.1 PhzF family phenazine biosynthesis protein [Pseudomonas taetrolens]